MRNQTWELKMETEPKIEDERNTEFVRGPRGEAMELWWRCESEEAMEILEGRWWMG